jgi:L-arabinokinase
MDMQDLWSKDGKPVDYAIMRERLAQDPSRGWAAYIAGAVLVLMHEKDLRLGCGTEAVGISILVSSDVPEGKGVSSSAAVEVATMSAVAAASGIVISSPRELAILCQIVENKVVGAPCGVMDQMASACGEEGRLMSMACRPAEVHAAVAIPSSMRFWGVDSGIKHSVGGADYGSVRVGAFMGRRIMAVHDAARNQIKSGGSAGHVTSAAASVSGTAVAYAASLLRPSADQRYLAALPVHLYESNYLHTDPPTLPSRISATEFKQKYGGHGDPATAAVLKRAVEEEAAEAAAEADGDSLGGGGHSGGGHAGFAVRQPTSHPVYENHRVKLFREMLRAAGARTASGLGGGGGGKKQWTEGCEDAEEDEEGQTLEMLGELMYQSHASYSRYAHDALHIM